MLALSARSVPLDRIQHCVVDPSAASDGFEAVPPAVIWIYAGVVDPDRSDPDGESLANLFVDRVRGLPVPLARRIVEDRAGSGTVGDIDETLLQEMRV